MNILPEIPKGELDCFKVNVKEWLEIDEQVNELNNQIKELKKKKNKLLEPKITGFMRSYNISDLNTEQGKLRCNQRNTRKPLSKSLIQESLLEIMKEQEKVDDAMDIMLNKREIVTTFKLSKVKK